MSRTWSGIKTTAAVGGCLSNLSHKPILSNTGARGSSTNRSPSDSTNVEVTTGCQSSSGFQNACLARQIQSPAASSRIPTERLGVFKNKSPDGLLKSYLT